MHRRLLLASALMGSTLLVGTVVLAVGSAAGASVTTQIQTAQDNLENCRLLQANATSTAQRTRARDCVSDQTRILTLLGVPPSTSPTPPASSTPATTPPSTPPPTSTPTTTPTTTPPATDFPDAQNTGVPAGVTLNPWTGSCSLTTANVTIDAMVFNCDVSVKASNVTFTRSRINGWVDNTGTAGASFRLIDSEVLQPGVRQLTSVGDHDFAMLRTEVTGGNRGVYCQKSCDIRDSWIHGQKIKDDWHASAVRMEQQLTLVHNTLVCDAPVQPNPEGSCSASLTGYGDFAAVRDNLIQGNYFPPTQYAAYCTYGGSSRLKPFSDGAMNNRFIDNVFGRGPVANNRDCALFGPVGDYDRTRPGNVWTGNRFSDGVVVPVPAF